MITREFEYSLSVHGRALSETISNFLSCSLEPLNMSMLYIASLLSFKKIRIVTELLQGLLFQLRLIVKQDVTNLYET